MVTAAGNSNSYGEYYYPCAYDQIICVAAVDRNYKRAWFSNYGAVIDAIAAGVDVISVGLEPGTPATYNVTSQACPHVTGAAAIFISVSLQNRGNLCYYPLLNV